MNSPPGLFCFTHVVSLTNGEDRRYCFAYKPPGPPIRGILDDLILATCAGPILPDALVVFEIAKDKTFDLRSELTTKTSDLARQRITERIPLLYSNIDLLNGKVKVELLDSYFKGNLAAFKAVISGDLRKWLSSGLSEIFDPKVVTVIAPPGYEYQKPSGDRARVFLKPDLALTSSSIVAFVAFALFELLLLHRIKELKMIKTIFVDTMAIAPVAYALRELFALFGLSNTFEIESFHSYGGIENVNRPLPRSSVCLISASTSKSLQVKWTQSKALSSDDAITLLTFTTAKHAKYQALHAIKPPLESEETRPSKSTIRVHGESFHPQLEPTKKVLLRDPVHRLEKDGHSLQSLCGRKLFDVYRASPYSGSKTRALHIDGKRLIEQEEFRDWLFPLLSYLAKASTKLILFQSDDASKLFATMVREYCQNDLGLQCLMIGSRSNLEDIQIEKDAGVIVCAAVAGKGSALLDISRSLRNISDGPRLYLIGIQVAEINDEIEGLRQSLTYSKKFPHEVHHYDKFALGTQLIRSFSEEYQQYIEPSKSSKGLPSLPNKRVRAIRSVARIGELALWPGGVSSNRPMRLRQGFAFWRPGYEEKEHTPELLAYIAAVLQRARDLKRLATEHSLTDSSYRHVVLDPENFARFNDGLIQAALLRTAYPEELDYRDDVASSEFVRSLINRMASKLSDESSESLLEFVLALQLKRLQLRNDDFAKVTTMLRKCADSHQNLKRAITYLLQANSIDTEVPSNLPF